MKLARLLYNFNSVQRDKPTFTGGSANGPNHKRSRIASFRIHGFSLSTLSGRRRLLPLVRECKLPRILPSPVCRRCSDEALSTVCLGTARTNSDSVRHISNDCNPIFDSEDGYFLERATGIELQQPHFLESRVQFANKVGAHDEEQVFDHPS